VDHLRHPEHPLVELDPVLHAAELDVADDVIDVLEANARVAPIRRLLRDVARQVRAFVAGAIDERVDDVAVGCDRRELDLAELVLDPARLGYTARAALHRLAVRVRRIGHAERDVLHAVAVEEGELADR
jgi:hypothetical protein